MDGTYITALRTADGSALATRLLARPDADVLLIVGAGVQDAVAAQLVMAAAHAQGVGIEVQL